MKLMMIRRWWWNESMEWIRIT